MITNTKELLIRGLELAAKTYAKAQEVLQWSSKALDVLVLHQVSKVHTEQLAALLGLDLDKVLRIYPEFGNIGPAAVPIVLSKAIEEGQVKPGSCVALMGIGSGLNCSMAEINSSLRRPNVMTEALPGYPFESRFAKIANFNYHYVDEGVGEPVLMVHGNPSWSYYYRNLIHQLKANYRTIAVDHLGCGLSDKPAADEYSFSLKQRVDDLVAFVESMAFETPFTLVLHDWGGMIGMALATRMPEKIKNIVLLNTGAFRNPKDMKLPWQLALVRNTPLGAFLVQGFNAFLPLGRPTPVAQKIPCPPPSGRLTCPPTTTGRTDWRP